MKRIVDDKFRLEMNMPERLKKEILNGKKGDVFVSLAHEDNASIGFVVI